MSMHALKIRTDTSPRVWTPWGAMPAASASAPQPEATERKTSKPSARRREWLEKAGRRKQG